MKEEEINQRIQKIADVLVDIVFSSDDILQTQKKATNVDVVKTDPVQAEFLNYGSR